MKVDEERRSRAAAPTSGEAAETVLAFEDNRLATLLFGLHDRPWGPQPVFGTVRSMGPNTFKKFDADAYVRMVEKLEAAERG